MALFSESAVKVVEKKLDLHVKYRPQMLDEVLGQDAIVNSLKGVIEKGMPHAFLFTGSAGTGKTTLARILANTTGASPANIHEVDAGIYTGVDDMRGLLEGLSYSGLSGNGQKHIILDECHMLTKGAWNSLLKILEEPPQHVYFYLCTTDPSKVPNTIVTRCHAYVLKDIKYDILRDLISFVAQQEKITLPDGVQDVLARYASGSARQALVGLSQVRHCLTREEASQVLQSAIDSPDVETLCRILTNRGPRWDLARKIIQSLKEESIDPESVRIQVVQYLMACVLKSTLEADSLRYLAMLESFSRPVYKSTGFAEVLLSFGDCILNKS